MTATDTPTYTVKMQLPDEVYAKSAEKFFKRETPDFVFTPTDSNGVWVEFDVPGDNDLTAGENLYNLLTRLEMDAAMRFGRPAKDEPLDVGKLIMFADSSRVVLASGFDR